MANIFEYIQKVEIFSFDELPINEIDGLVFSRLAYLHFEGLIEGNYDTWQPLAEVEKKFDYDSPLNAYPHADEDLKLLKLIAQSKRYKNIPVSGYIYKLDIHEEEQFSVLSYKIDEKLIFIAFSGTDETLVGWKENFNMTYMAPVPAQRDAVLYVEGASQVFEYDFILGGHSKGGNLATYSAAFSSLEVQDRIKAVYNYDGPGFMEDLIQQNGYRRVEHKIHTFVPESSFFGLILARKEKYHIVKSEGTIFLQHNLYAWQIENNQFVYIEKLADESSFIDATINTWLSNMSKEQLENFVEAMFEVLTVGGATTINDFNESGYQRTVSLLKQRKNIDAFTKDTLSEALKNILKSAQHIIKKHREETI